jgi:hypothetical protein
MPWLLEMKASPMSMVGFPLLLIPLAIYNIIVFLMPGVSFTDPVLKLTLVSGAEWAVTLSDMLLALAILMLLSEVIKGARPGAKYLTDHLLSLIVFGAAAAEFLLWPRFASSTFFLLALLALVDFLSGIALRTRREKRTVSSPAVASRGRQAPAAPSEPQFAPPPEPAAPAAASVAESVLLDHPQPKVPEPEVVKPEVVKPEVPKPEVPKPEVPKPEVPKTEVPKTEVLQPEVAKPEVVEPEVLEPEVLEPEVSKPEVPKPEAAPNPPAPEVTPQGPQPGGSASPSPDQPPRDGRS